MIKRWKNGAVTTVTVEGDVVTVVDDLKVGTKTQQYSAAEIVDLVNEHDELSTMLLRAAECARNNT